MFDRIARRYDLLNHLLSAGTDIRWRRRAVRLLDPQPGWRVLDLATGTGDFAFEAASRGPVRVTGVDLSVPMLRVGCEKRRGRAVDLLCGDAEGLPFRDGAFDGVTVGFGIRNVAHLDAGLREMGRVLRRGGRAVILEFSRPRTPVLSHLYMFYFKNLLPRIGALVSGDRVAYTYLYESVMRFPEGQAFLSAMAQAGFREVREHRLTFGIATVYVGEK
jgi:demethylmenaquinone methyltransferase/2-methoxy-6-polyprenyl-1,4-benzoquinol methylase